MERKRWVRPLAAKGLPRSWLVAARLPGVAGTKAPALSDLWLGRRILRFRSLFPFPFLQRSHREQRPPQGEERALAVRLSAPLYQVGSAPRGPSTGKQMAEFEAVGVLEKASHPPSYNIAARATILAQTEF